MSSPTTLEGVKAELQSWRQQRTSLRSKIPDDIRQKIIFLRNTVSMTRLTTELGINSTMIRSWTGEPTKPSAKKPSPAFMPLPITHDCSSKSEKIELRCELPNGQQWQLSGCCTSEQEAAFVQSLYHAGRPQS